MEVNIMATKSTQINTNQLITRLDELFTKKLAKAVVQIKKQIKEEINPEAAVAEKEYRKGPIARNDKKRNEIYASSDKLAKTRKEDFTFPPFKRIPDEIIERHPDMAKFNNEDAFAEQGGKAEELK
jgi:uncharacterized protein (DUF2132 family)